MSWVQQNAPTLPPTLPQQHSQQQQPQKPPPLQQQQHNSYIQQQSLNIQPPPPQQQQQQSLVQSNSNITNAYTTSALTSATALPPAPPLVTNFPPPNGAYINKSIATNNNINNNNNNALQPQHSSGIRPPMHTNGDTHQQQIQQQPQSDHFSMQQHPPTSAPWPQQAYGPPTKIMQPNAAIINSNWQVQQQPQQQHTNDFYGTQPSAQQHNIWQPPDVQTAPPVVIANNSVPLQSQQQQQQYPHQTTYDNYFTSDPLAQQQQQPPPVPSSSTAMPTQPATQHQQAMQPLSHDTSNYFQPQQQLGQQTQVQPVPAAAATEFFDKGKANKGDGWGDWDWNDNGNVIGGEVVEQALAEQQQQQPKYQTTQLPIKKPMAAQQPYQQQEQQQQQQNNSNVIADSFATQSNDNWNWNLGDGANANTNNVSLEKSTPAPPPPPSILATQVPTNTNQRQAAQVPPQLANSVPAPQHKVAEYAVAGESGVTTTTDNFLGKPISLPLGQSVNENYNIDASVAPITAVGSIATTTNSNIPNSVYVSQAKPVSRPSRQYASPAGVATPTDDVPLDNALMPPQGFQNEITPTQPEIVSTVAASVANLSLQNPPPAMTPPSNLPPPPAANATAVGNPFKRAGAPQHHRAGLLATNVTVPVPSISQLESASVAAAFAVPTPPPPPPADFANPIMLNNLEPDNSEVLHENQEVLGITMPASSISVTSKMITLPGAAQETPATAQASQPNDERNQYLQTSPLSENPDEELNLEADSLPPPGLSRLVLGQPELLEASQRMVTGTEEPANMHRDERHADGEDTSVEQSQVVPFINVSQRGNNFGGSSTVSVANSNTIDITTDRNLYLVPGESNANNEQRVVTGVEMSPNTNALPPPSPPLIASGQREIELDGENLEDQQQQQHRQQQQLPLEPPPLLTVNSRDEPPLEGAAANNEQPARTTAENQEGHNLQHHHQHGTHHHHQHQAKPKDLSNASTGNDESDQISGHEHHHHHHASHYTSSNKVRKHSGGGELERKVTDRQQQQRRDKPPSSADRYESDDLELEESEPYFRDRERERDRRRDYREGSVRSDRERADREYVKDKRRRGVEKRDERTGERDKLHDKYYERKITKSDAVRRSIRHNHQYENEVDDLNMTSGRRKEKSRRSGGRQPVNDERAGRSDRSEREYDDYTRRPRGSAANKRADKGGNDDGREGRRSTYTEDERREQRRTRRERGVNVYDTTERRNRTAADKSIRGGERDRGDARGEYEEYRKQSSRNARESDLEKERTRYDPRHAAMYGYAPGAYGYDPYASYYYEQMARTNPQAYTEWYKKYYGHATSATATTSGLGGVQATASADHVSLNSSSLAAATADGRESVHSGRSSVQNDKERYTHAYISHANEYHRHMQQRQQLMNMSLNSTMFDDVTGGVYAVGEGGVGRVEGGDEAMRSARSTSNLSQIGSSIGCGIGAGGGALTAYYSGIGGVGAAYYARSDYAESRSGHLSLRDADAIAETDPQRLTPRKFVNEHTIVSISAGILVLVKPKYTAHGAISNIVKLQRLGANDATRQLLQAYPGPLVRGLTHKKTIIEFCEEQIRLGPLETTIYAKQLVCNNIEKYRGSYTLMWNLLILLLRQNGMVVGTDIAELLLKNQQQFPYQTETANDDGSTTSLSADEAQEQTSNELTAIEQDKTENADNNETDAKSVVDKQTLKSTTTTISDATDALAEAEITKKFRNYLLYGNVNEALDWATDNNLWGHALFLASKVDRRSHANVMMKFANKLSLNDPLQTLYQLMSGRQPSSVTSVQDEKWGDWRPHLSMILSNTSQKPELDRKSITTLGDSLLNRGDLFAAHFCYLMAQVGFGRYQESATQETTLQQHLPKLVLLGSSHYKTFSDFAINEAIIMTEIYEYACSLNDEKFSLVEFQPYKYLFATRLLDYGYHLRSLMYFEQIAMHIQRDPSKYEPSFINKIYEFADRLKYYDPVLERSMDDQQQNADENLNENQLAMNFEEQKWLQDLRDIAVQHRIDYTSPATEGYEQIADTQNQIDQQFVELNEQFNALNMQYNNLDNTEQTPTFYNPDTLKQQQEQQSLQQPQEQQPYNDLSVKNYNQQQQQQQPGGVTDYNSQQMNAEPQSTNILDTTGQKQPIDSTEQYAYYNQQQQQQQQQPYMQPQIQQQQDQHLNSYYDPIQQQQTYQGYGSDMPNLQNNANSYDYWGQQPQQQHGGYGDENARPTISMPKSKIYDSDEAKQRQSQQKNSVNEGITNKIDQQRSKNDKETNKSSQQGNQNSGWFGGIWNKLSLKPKNQMILPDDKNPSIVWDPDKKRWVNMDGDETAEESFKPPPKMSDIMGQVPTALPPQQYTQQPQHQQQQHLQPQTAQTAPLQPLPLLDTHHYTAGSIVSPAPTTNTSSLTAQSSSSSTAPISGYSAQGLTGTDAAGATKTPSLQSNMFKMQRNRTLKNSYVDVFNPSGAPMKTAENVLAPSFPPAVVPQSGFFIPGTAPGGPAIVDNNDAGAYQQQQQQQQQPQPPDVPQFYNPNQFGGGAY